VHSIAEHLTLEPNSTLARNPRGDGKAQKAEEDEESFEVSATEWWDCGCDARVQREYSE
jgi:hypothetical protein